MLLILKALTAFVFKALKRVQLGDMKSKNSGKDSQRSHRFGQILINFRTSGDLSSYLCSFEIAQTYTLL